MIRRLIIVVAGLVMVSFEPTLEVRYKVGERGRGVVERSGFGDIPLAVVSGGGSQDR